MKRSLTTSAPEATRSVGRALGEIVTAGAVVVLTGDLGAGKTVLAKGVAEGLDVAEEVTSPTFNILLVHAGRVELAHFDLYRLEREAELEDIDFWGVLESGAACLVEWGDRFPDALPADVLIVSLAITGDESRRIDIDPSGPRSGKLAEAWVAASVVLPGVEVEVGEGQA